MNETVALCLTLLSLFVLMVLLMCERRESDERRGCGSKAVERLFIGRQKSSVSLNDAIVGRRSESLTAVLLLFVDE